MLLSDLLGLQVVDAQSRRVGTVIDVRLAAPQDPDQQVPTRLLGFVISPNTRSSYLGYERTDIAAPWLLAAVLRWRHRGTFLAAWDDIARVGSNALTLRGDISASRPDSVRRTESAGVFRGRAASGTP